ncbi:flagellar hook-associated protein FlgK [Lysobacter niastensis]|nr:flagellar hook-associated protein FlgK [Lysobacter niastensis]
MTGMLSTGSSALLAFQRALSTVGHNVANAATPGYSRQRVDLVARPGIDRGAGAIGTGVDVQALQRLADSLVFARQIDSSGEVGRLQQLSDSASRVDKLLSDSASGLSGPWSAFFGAVEGVVSAPTSQVARSQLLDSARQLTSRWQSIDGQLARMESDTNADLKAHVESANQLANEIANLNRDIVGAGSNASPDLIDQRALRINKLAALVGVTAVEQDNGAINLFTTGGQPLVLNQRAMGLATTQDPYRSDRLQLAVQGAQGPVPLPAGTVSGEIGGLLEFRSRVLDPSRAELGRLATAFAQSFNATQRAGVDYNGNPGADVFSIPPPRTSAHSGNTGTATLSASIADLGQLTGQDVVLRFDGTAWNATRAGSGEAVPITGTGNAADPLRVGGVSLVVGGTPASGDRFMLQPTAAAAANIRVSMTDPNGIAAAQPIQSTIDEANLGNAKPGATRVTDPIAFASFAGATIDFIDANQYTIDGAGPFGYTPGTPIAGNGWSLSLEGTPAAGDSFTLARTPPRSSDNANARLLAAIDDNPVLAGGTLALTTAMSQFSGSIGSEARHAKLTLDAQTAIDKQVAAEVDSLSGVNLDEEAANLMRFQQAYQAAAQVISTADTMFQTLLSSVRR